MNWKLAMDIAVTHLVTKKKQSLVAMLGVLFGISMFLVMISFMTGVNRFLEDLAMDNTPDIHIYNPVEIKRGSIIGQADSAVRSAGSVNPGGPASHNAPGTGPASTAGNSAPPWYIVLHQRPQNDLPKIKNAQFISEGLEKMPEVMGVAPQVTSQVFFNNGPVQIQGEISGIDVRKQERLFGLDKKMDEGSLDDLLKGNDVIVMGSGLAAKVSAHPGDQVSVTTPEGYNLVLKVVGIFSFGITTFDDTKSYTTLATVQKILQHDPSYITDLNVKLKNMRLSASLATQLQEQLPGLRVEGWEAANQSILAGEKIRDIMTAVVSFTMLLVAGFGIYNIMNMNIINKMKDIAILKATGFQGKDITAIFLFQSLIIGLLGGILGLLVGYVFCFLLSITPFPAGSFIRISTYPVSFDPLYYILGILFGFLTTLFAGFFPALKASKIDPVSILRN
jgi:lipoprotein-releasing system permease protein